MGVAENLLQKADALHFKYQALNELEKRDFNVFTILFKSTDEVNLHSRMLAELLNPQGMHKKSGRFLQLFLDRVAKETRLSTADLRKCMVLRESHHIDILVLCGRRAIIIENKINAPDQKEQLARYYKTVQQIYRIPADDIQILYLTPNGRSPSKKSLGDVIKEDKVNALSYDREILDWLEDCVKEAAEDPPLRESLIQYKRVVEEITGNTLSEVHMNELKDLLLKNREYLRAAIDISAALPEARKEVELRFWGALKEALSNRISKKTEDYNIEKAGNFKTSDPWRGLSIPIGPCGPSVNCSYVFEMDGRGKVSYGFYYNHDAGYPEEELSKIRDKVVPIDPEFASDSWWFGWKDAGLDFVSFDNDESRKILQEEGLHSCVQQLAEEAAKHIKEFEARMHS